MGFSILNNLKKIVQYLMYNACSFGALLSPLKIYRLL